MTGDQGVRAAIDRFVERYNLPGSDIYPCFGDEVDWIEMPSGRRGDRAALFDAIRDFRDAFADPQLKVVSITAGAADGVLESELTARRRSDGARLHTRTIWIMSFQDGKIVKEHDYSFLLTPLP